ncbi:MAG: BREX-1 system adenine-specific DNA-methyltransferase PglX [Halanaerobiales bacterium]|nr:BREX-1 system adenine-specific DNA-methyltransferase PglX [Halanaerobiales bacterium]
MNLEENVNKIKEKIYVSYHKRLVRLGVREEKFKPRDKEDEDYKKAKATIEAIMEDTNDFSEARDEYLDEVTFTLFNRIAGIKTMESESRQLIPEAIQIRAQHGDKSFAHNVWLEENPDKSRETLEGLSGFIRDRFNDLSDKLPLYSNDHPFDLMPETHDLKDVIRLFNEEISLEEWEKDDILGWLYESYNKKDYKDFKESGDKIEWDKLSLSSQMYTPRWVVEFLVNNSLGKYWLEMNPTSKIKENHDIANAPEDPVLDYKEVEDIKVIDPAVGSGNFLLYAFELLTEIYEEEGYDKKEIPSRIIQNNLYGLDIDERAIQIARLQLYIKAKTYNRNTKINDINIVSSNFHLPEFDMVKEEFSMNLDFASNERDFLKELWNELRNAHKFGSLLTLDQSLSKFFEDKKENDSLGLFDSITDVDNLEVDVLNKLKDIFSKTVENNYSSNFIKYQSLDAVKFAEIMLGVNKNDDSFEVNKYDIAFANPPYTDSSNYGKELKNYVSDKYKNPTTFYKNLYSCFLKKNYDFINEHGKIAMITPETFMYLKSYEDMRKFILRNIKIEIFVEWGYLGIFSEETRVSSGFYIFSKNKTNKSLFIKLDDMYERKRKNEFDNIINCLIDNKENPRYYIIAQEKLKIINGYPFIYWISDSFRKKFKKSSLGEILDIVAGVQTSNNLRFLRFWWEVEKDDISENYAIDNKRWVPYQKGGEYKKWYGNNWLIIDWEDSGRKLQEYLKSKGQDLHAQNYYFKEGITYTDASAKESFRYLPPNNIFDISGSCIFSNNPNQNIYYNLGLLNAILVNYITESLNGSIHTQVGDMKRIPYVTPDKYRKNLIKNLTKKNIKEKKEQYKFDIIEKEFELSPLDYNWYNHSLNIEQRLKSYINIKYESDCRILLNESIIDNLIFDVYELTESDKRMVLEQEGLPEGLYPILKQDKNKYIKNNNSELEEAVIEFIEDLPIENGRARANLKDNVKKLYLKDTSLKDISNDLKLNPISVVEIIKEFDFYPEKLAFQKAHEFILDVTREILMEDDDGLVMVNEYAGEEPLDKMIENKLYDKGFSSGDIKRVESMLGKSIKKYLLSKLFKDECNTLNLFMFLPKTPFIWHLSSGKKHGFDVYTIIYRWNRDKILKIKSYYTDKRKTGLKNSLADLAGDDSASAEKEKDKLKKQLKEIEYFEDKLDELLSSGYEPELDDGVGKNIAPLQDLGLIADDVLTKSQLKKFLNADW